MSPDSFRMALKFIKHPMEKPSKHRKIRFFRNSFYVEGIAAVVLGSVTCKLAEDAFKMATRWLMMELSWPPDGSKSLQDGFKLSLFWLLDRIFASRSLKVVGRRWFYDGSKVAYGGRKWLKLDLRRTHDGLGRPEDGPR